MELGQIQHKPGEVVNPQISDLDGIHYIGLFWSEKLMIRILDLSHQYFLSYEVRSFWGQAPTFLEYHFEVKYYFNIDILYIFGIRKTWILCLWPSFEKKIYIYLTFDLMMRSIFDLIRTRIFKILFFILKHWVFLYIKWK